jgi:hypothetical protein
MLYLAIDQHRKQLTVNLRNEQGDVLVKRQVSTGWPSVRSFLEEVRKTSVSEHIDSGDARRYWQFRGEFAGSRHARGKQVSHQSYSHSHDRRASPELPLAHRTAPSQKKDWPKTRYCNPPADLVYIRLSTSVLRSARRDSRPRRRPHLLFDIPNRRNLRPVIAFLRPASFAHFSIV